MKDPTAEIAHAVYERSTTLLAGVAECYELAPPDEGATMPYAVIELASISRDGSKAEDGSEVLVQARVCTDVLDHSAPGAVGDMLMEGLLPDVISTTASHRIIQAIFDIGVPPRVVRDGNDSWTETLYRFRYLTEEI